MSSDGVMELLCSRRVIPVAAFDRRSTPRFRLPRRSKPGGLPVGGGHVPHARAQPAQFERSPPIGRILVGAGTVVAPDQVDQAVDAGRAVHRLARLQPAWSSRAASELGVAVCPGVATATEVMAALERGLDAVKFFPAEPLRRRRDCCRRCAGPFPDVRFVPTGGIDGRERWPRYLALPYVARGRRQLDGRARSWSRRATSTQIARLTAAAVASARRLAR